MVRIVNGEIVDDDASQSSSRSAGNPHQSPLHNQRSPSGQQSNSREEWWKQPPLRLVHNAGPTTMFGLTLPVNLPDIEVFGIAVPAHHLIIAAVVGLVFGWRMMLFISVLFVIFKVNASPPSTARPAATSGSARASNPGAEFLQRYLQDNPSAKAGGGSTAGQPSKHNWGRGQKLGSA